MTSQVHTTSNLINPGFPIEGQDNPSRGFRDNFTNIQLSFSTVDDELTKLQAQAVLKAPMNDGDVVNNDMLGSVIKNVTLQGQREVAVNHTLTPVDAQNGHVHVSYADGTYHKYGIDGSHGNVIFEIDWPAVESGSNTYLHKVGIEVTNASTQTSRVSFAAGTGNTLQIDNSQGLSLPFVISQAGNPTIFEIQTIDGGVTQLLRFVGGPYLTV
jgi:hypothetical protein